MQNKIPVLCTRPLSDELIESVAQLGIEIDVLPFIEVEAIESVEIQQEIEAAMQAEATVVFTSMNAVEAVVENCPDEQPAWKIYCIGNTTARLIHEYFPLSVIIGTADNATALASMIIEEGETEELIFFCGNRRREELPTLLRKENIEVDEIVVYQTLELPQKITKDYFGILFFSPSAVDSFFKNNKLTTQTVLFAIGNTTEAAIRKYTSNKIVIADQPGKEELVEKMVEYFT